MNLFQVKCFNESEIGNNWGLFSMERVIENLQVCRINDPALVECSLEEHDPVLQQSIPITPTNQLRCWFYRIISLVSGDKISRMNSVTGSWKDRS